MDDWNGKQAGFRSDLAAGSGAFTVQGDIYENLIDTPGGRRSGGNLLGRWNTQLLGSLLEQLGEDYLFVYTPDHITVAVKQGGFPASNHLFLPWQGEVWLIAEGTAPGFRIGVDHLQE